MIQVHFILLSSTCLGQKVIKKMNEENWHSSNWIIFFILYSLYAYILPLFHFSMRMRQQAITTWYSHATRYREHEKSSVTVWLAWYHRLTKFVFFDGHEIQIYSRYSFFSNFFSSFVLKKRHIPMRPVYVQIRKRLFLFSSFGLTPISFHFKFFLTFIFSHFFVQVTKRTHELGFCRLNWSFFQMISSLFLLFK